MVAVPVNTATLARWQQRLRALAAAADVEHVLAAPLLVIAEEMDDAMTKAPTTCGRPVGGQADVPCVLDPGHASMCSGGRS